MGQAVKIRYNGKRYPRTINLRGGGKISFFNDRNVIALSEYDALYLLKFNSRINPEKWEFTIEALVNNEVNAVREFKEVKEVQPLGESQKTDKRTKEYKKMTEKGDR